jgi:acetyl esterase/lipase
MGSSKEAKAIVDLYRFMKGQSATTSHDSIKDARYHFELCSTLTAEPTEVNYEEVGCPGTVRPAIWCKPSSADATYVILYLHGGGCFMGSPSSHRKLAAHLAKAVGAYALVPDFRLAPQFRFPSQINDVVATYKWLLECGYTHKNIILAGDSAGGNLAITVPVKLREDGIGLPGGVMAISPWIDMEAKGESLDSNAQNDVFATRGTEIYFSELYLGTASPKLPAANPLYADLTGLPPMHISVGGWEVLLSDAERLAERARKAGVDITYEVGPEMQHVYQLMAGRAPEADRTIENMAQWLKEKVMSK